MMYADEALWSQVEVSIHVGLTALVCAGIFPSNTENLRNIEHPIYGGITGLKTYF